MTQVFVTAKLPVDLQAEDAQKYLVSLQRVLKPGCIAVGNIDQDTQHCKEVFIRDHAKPNQLRPRFDFEYQLRDIGKYNEMSWAGADITYEEAMFLYSLVFMMKPLTVVETGMGVGLSTVHIAQALIDNQRGELYSVEVDPNRIQGSVGMLNAFGFKEQVSVISQDSTRLFREWQRPVDIAILDTTSTAAQMEFELLSQHIKHEGIIVSKYALNVPPNLWRRVNLFGARDLWIYQKGAVAAFDGPRLTEMNVGFKPEQAEWAGTATAVTADAVSTDTVTADAVNVAAAIADITKAEFNTDAAVTTPVRKALPVKVIEITDEPARRKAPAKPAAKPVAKPVAKKGSNK
jgi:predicted O-methyltransferase YrrM